MKGVVDVDVDVDVDVTVGPRDEMRGVVVYEACRRGGGGDGGEVWSAVWGWVRGYLFGAWWELLKGHCLKNRRFVMLS